MLSGDDHPAARGSAGIWFRSRSGNASTRVGHDMIAGCLVSIHMQEDTPTAACAHVERVSNGAPCNCGDLLRKSGLRPKRGSSSASE